MLRLRAQLTLSCPRRSYSLTNGDSFVAQAAQSQYDVAGRGDTEGTPADALQQRASTLKWDRRQKKFVRGDQVGADNKKLIKSESGQKLSASFKSGVFDEWKKKQRIYVPKVGEEELKGRSVDNGGRPGDRKFRHKAGVPNADGEKRKGRTVGKPGRLGAVPGGLKGAEEIRKDRKTKAARGECIVRRVRSVGAHHRNRHLQSDDPPSLARRAKVRLAEEAVVAAAEAVAGRASVGSRSILIRRAMHPLHHNHKIALQQGTARFSTYQRFQAETLAFLSAGCLTRSETVENHRAALSYSNVLATYCSRCTEALSALPLLLLVFGDSADEATLAGPDDEIWSP